MNCSPRLHSSPRPSGHFKRLLQFLSLLLCLPFSCSFADLPTRLQTAVDRERAQRVAKHVAAKKSLLAAFEERIAEVRDTSKLTAEERQEVIEVVESQKAMFEKQGIIPFSNPAMRKDVIDYLNTLKDADVPLAKAYDKGIEFYTKKSQDDAAKTLVADKHEVLKPKVVGVWELSYVGKSDKWTKTLHSDGSTLDGTWTLDQDHLVIRTPSNAAPDGAWVATHIVSQDGMHTLTTDKVIEA